MGIITFIIPFIVLITLVVFIHEYGHYYFARKYGVGVTDFSIGFGKEIFGFNDKSGTRWKFCLIPLGGYVKFFGDRNVFSQAEQEELLKQYSKEDQQKLFVTKPIYQRSLVVAAGPFANFLLAIVIFTFIYMFSGKDFTPAKIDGVQKNSPAFVAGLKKDDVIFSIDGKKVKSILDVSTYINVSTADEVSLVVLRNNSELTFSIIPNTILDQDSLGNDLKRKIIGIKITPLYNDLNNQKLGPVKAIYYAVKETWFVTTSSLDFIFSLFKGKGDTSQLGGPIKIAKITGQVAQHGVIAFLSITAYISISLGLINLFPIPMLDGGHLMFYAFEKILGRPLTQRTQEGFFRIGLFLLFSLMFFTTFNDLKNIGIF
jgi:regulator of sigma E protease|tara:strand:+ start:109 stop:1224 length:1116 start_codon:yes stop_codon:yes gene_type:complete